MTSETLSIEQLLAHPENAFWLECVHRAEHANPASTLNRLRKMTTDAPPITINRNSEILDGRHRTLIAIERGHTTIRANRKT